MNIFIGHLIIAYLTPVYEVWGKVMFSQVCVILFTGGLPSHSAKGQADSHPSIIGDRSPPHIGGNIGGRPYPPPPLQIRSTGGRYSSYWNPYLFVRCFWDFTDFILLLWHCINFFSIFFISSLCFFFIATA